MSRKKAKSKVKEKKFGAVLGSGVGNIVGNKKSDIEIIDAITNGKLDVSIEPKDLNRIEEQEKEKEKVFFESQSDAVKPFSKYEWLKINANYIDGSVSGELFKKNPARADIGGYDPAILVVKKKFDWLIKNGYEVHNVTEVTLGSYLVFVFRRND